jgi:hypothetical protein
MLDNPLPATGGWSDLDDRWQGRGGGLRERLGPFNEQQRE